MIKTTAINLVKSEPLMVTWDVGRRCNYDCSYCEASRHDLVSPHHSLEEFKSTFEFIQKWTSTYNKFRRVPSTTNINFTGGEPTVNPKFWELVDYVKDTDHSFKLSLTTNGAWSPKNTEKIVKHFEGVTVSYHAEAHQSLKDNVIKNILALSQTDIWLQVNVMLHADHWEETTSVFKMLKEKGIRCNPRPIGDGNVERSGWFIDSDGSNRRTSHSYSAEQQQWFWEQMGVKGDATQQQQGTQLGRACCGGRCLTGKVNNEWQPVKLVNTEFKGWQCMVDWYFLHIDQHTGLVYHHQTCQALHNNKKGAVGHLKDSNLLIAELEQRLEKPTPIICPNQRCGCGMCIPKAKDTEDFTVIWNNLVSVKPAQETT